MNFLVIDDNDKTSTTLSSLLKSSGATVNVFEELEPYRIRSVVTNEGIDIVFIRLRLWEPWVFQRVATERMPLFVFLSGGKEKVTDKEATTIDYGLREPYTMEALRKLLNQVTYEPRGAKRERPYFFFVRFEGRYHRISFGDIELVERLQGNYVKMHTRVGVFLLPGTLSAMEERLPAEDFERVSGSLMLPKTAAQSLDGEVFVYKGKEYRVNVRKAAVEQEEAWMEAYK